MVPPASVPLDNFYYKCLPSVPLDVIHRKVPLSAISLPVAKLQTPGSDSGQIVLLHAPPFGATQNLCKSASDSWLNTASPHLAERDLRYFLRG
jgi:hypothetical protein